MGMKTSVKTRAEIRDEAILIGSRIINEQGLRGFGLRQVASEIGYTVGSLYNVFKNQSDLLLHINACTLDELYNFILHKISANKKTGIDCLRIIAYSYLEFAQKKYKLWCLLYDDTLVTIDETPDWYIERVNRLFAIIENALISQKYKLDNVREYVCTLWSGVHGICTLALSGKLNPAWSDSPLLLIDNLIDNYTSGLSSIKV